MLRSLAAWCYRRRRLVVVAWIVALVGVSVLGQTVGGDLLKTFSLPGTESQRAFDVLEQQFAAQGRHRQPRVRGAAATARSTTRRSAQRDRTGVRGAARSSRTSSASRARTSPRARASSREDGKIAYAEILFDVQSNDVPARSSRPTCARSPKDANSDLAARRARGQHVHRADACPRASSSASSPRSSSC